jgi:hypothetical protein
MRPNIQRQRGGTSAHYRASRFGSGIPRMMAPRSHRRSNAAWRDLICRGGLCSILLAACRAVPAFNSPCRRSQTLRRDAALVAALKNSRSGRYRSAERLDLTREPRTGRRCAWMTQRQRLTTSAMSTANVQDAEEQPRSCHSAPANRADRLFAKTFRVGRSSKMKEPSRADRA